MVGSALLRALRLRGGSQILVRERSQLDLIEQSAVRGFFDSEQPDYVYLAAAKVGGIHANNHFPADFIYENLMIQCNVIEAAFRSGVKKLLFFGSGCIYPRLAVQPTPEDALLTGKVELTNEPFAVAKIAGIKLCESFNRQYEGGFRTDFRCVVPAGVYGPGDNYHPENSHVIPGLIRRFHEAKLRNVSRVDVWGSGSPLREFLFVDDLAAASLQIMELGREEYARYTKPMQGHVNVGSGREISIRELAGTIARVVGFSGEVYFDFSKPDGAPKKLLDSKILDGIGWRPQTDFERGLRVAYRDFIENYQKKSGEL